MTDRQPPDRNVLFTEEQADRARARLRALLRDGVPLGKVRVPGSLDSELNSESNRTSGADGHEDDAGRDLPDDRDIDDLFPFKPVERDLIDRVDRIIRRRMTTVEPASLKAIAAFLFALERLPYATHGVSLILAIASRDEGNDSYVSIELDGQSFCLSTEVWTRGEADGEGYAETVFALELGGFREGTTRDFEAWLDQFSAVQGGIELQGEADVDFASIAPEDGWDRLDQYWESEWEDEVGDI